MGREQAKARAYELALQRHTLEETAEEEVGALVGTLGELRALDEEQRQAEIDGFVRDPKGYDQRPRLFRLTSNWISDRLGGPEGFLNLRTSKTERDKPLAERDPLAARETEERSTT